jgi:hypothetical protein
VSGHVYVPVFTAMGDWKGKSRRADIFDALTDLLLYSQSLAYLDWQIEVCRECLREGFGSEPHVRILGEKAAEYAQQLLDERYGAVPA